MGQLGARHCLCHKRVLGHEIDVVGQRLGVELLPVDACCRCLPGDDGLLGVVVVVKLDTCGCVGCLGPDIDVELGLGAGASLVGDGDNQLDITSGHGDLCRGLGARLDSACGHLSAIGRDGVVERAVEGIALVGGGGCGEGHCACGRRAIKVGSQVGHCSRCLVGGLRLDDTQVDEPCVVGGLHQLCCRDRSDVGVDLIEVALLVGEHRAPVEASGVRVIGHRTGVGRDVVDAQVAQRHDLDLGAAAHIGGADGIEPSVLTDAVEHALVVAGDGGHRN